jgi:hypothetical protein
MKRKSTRKLHPKTFLTAFDGGRTVKEYSVAADPPGYLVPATEKELRRSARGKATISEMPRSLV